MNSLNTERVKTIKGLLEEVKTTLQKTRKNEFMKVVDVLDDATKVMETVRTRTISVPDVEMSIQKLISSILLLENMEEYIKTYKEIQDIIDRQPKIEKPFNNPFPSKFDDPYRVWVSTQYGDRLFTKEAADAREACS